MNTKRTDSKSIWKVRGISLVALTLIFAGSAVASELRNGVPETGLSGEWGEELHFFLKVPAGAEDLSFSFSVGTGDPRLYIRFGAPPTLSTYHPASPGPWGPMGDGGGGLLSPYPSPGTWYVMVYAFDDFSDFEFQLSYVCDVGCENPNQLHNGVPKSGLSAGEGEELHFFLELPDGADNLEFSISGGTGDADLYVNFDSPPTSSTWACRPYASGNDETCPLPSAAPGTWYVMVYGYEAISGVSLVGRYDSLNLIFADGFESGDLSRWSSSVP
ncbi:MAG: hypothetical protein GY856_14920 [bacterium]|nr:hypothetical protein [bacterium]